MENGTYLVAVTVKDCAKKDRRLVANKRTVALASLKVTQKTADEIMAISRKTGTTDGAEIIESAVSYYAKLLREGVKVG